MPIVTNGKVIFTRRITTGDYEHRDAVVELSFTLEEGEDLSTALASVAEAARVRGEAMASGKEVAAVAQRPAKPPGTVAAEAGRAALAGYVDQKAVETASSAKVREAAKPPKEKPNNAAASMADIGEAEAEGVMPAPAEANTVEITDQKMLEHITHANAGGKQTMAIRALIEEFVGPPPGKVRDIPRERRQDFINRLPKP